MVVLSTTARKKIANFRANSRKFPPKITALQGEKHACAEQEHHDRGPHGKLRILKGLIII